MKYIREKNGKKVVVEKRRRSKQYKIRAAVKWTICIGLLLLIVLLCMFLNKKLAGQGLIKELMGKIDLKQESTETELPAEEEDRLTVCLDPGHGGNDPGTEKGDRKEADDTLRLAKVVKQKMEEKGIEVIMTREGDDLSQELNKKLRVKKRAKIANDSNADLFISLHRNKGDGYGVETWIGTQAGEEEQMLAQEIQSGLIAAGIQRDRGVKRGSQGNANENYYVVGNTNMPACLIELGFINNDEDNRLYDVNLDAYADAIVAAAEKTYQQYGEVGQAAKTEAVSGTENASEAGAQQGVVSPTGLILSNPQIENIESLSSETLNWGQGNNVDDKNRPTGATMFQEKYGKYSADFIIPEERNIIYLSFDEGYEYGCTPSILSTLKEKNVPAVFFVTEPYAKSEPELVQQIIDSGNILGNHSVNHPANGLPSESLEEQRQEVMGNHEYIKENFGYDMYLFRYPAGKFSEQSLAIVNNCNYRSVFWSFAYLDYDVNNQPDKTEALNKLMEKLHPGAIYLLHAESQTNTEILGEFIDKVREAGYEFGVYSDTISQ